MPHARCPAAVPADVSLTDGAAAVCLLASQSVHLHLREQTAAYMELHRDEFEHFVCHETEGQGDDAWDAYIANLRKPAFWAGEPEIRALATVLGVRFKISTPHSLFGIEDAGTSAGVVSYTAGDCGTGGLFATEPVRKQHSRGISEPGCPVVRLWK